MLFIVDGSGPENDKVYDTEMSTSFCKKIFAQLGVQRAVYRRGPCTIANRLVVEAQDVPEAGHGGILDRVFGIRPRTGLQLFWETNLALVPIIANPLGYGITGAPTVRVGSQVADRAAEYAQLIRKLPQTEKIYLCGYSRGGAAAVEVAKRIPDRTVEAMFLFDAVDRDAVVETDVVPANVENVYHAMRDPDFAANFLADAARSHFEIWFDNIKNTGRHLSNLKRQLNAYSNARPYFGNTGTRCASNKTKYVRKTFAGTHGALGGVPWTDIPGDPDIVPVVQGWMWQHFSTHGLVGSV